MSAVSEEGFFRRWARRKANPADEPAPEAPAAAGVTAPPGVAAQAQVQRREPEPVERDPVQRDPVQPERPLPTLEDVARLTGDSDYSAFVARGVDKSVQRMALKKLFADPHFNVMDGLDIYIDDYNKVAPLAPDMLAALKHAPGVLSSLFGDDGKEAPDEGAPAAAAMPAGDAADDPAGASPDAPADDCAAIPDSATPPTPRQGNA